MNKQDGSDQAGSLLALDPAGRAGAAPRPADVSPCLLLVPLLKWRGVVAATAEELHKLGCLARYNNTNKRQQENSVTEAVSHSSYHLHH